MIYLDWTPFKNLAVNKNYAITAVTQATGYFLMSRDFETFVKTGTADYTDFVNNYLSSANLAFVNPATAVQQYQRPAQMNNRVYRTAQVSTVTAASTTLLTVTSGKTFYLTSYGLSCSNTMNNIGNVNISDDEVAVRLPLVVESKGTSTMCGSFPQPMKFTVNVALKILVGTLTASAWVVGYEETN